MRVSASKMATYAECPMRAKFRYIDKLPQRTSSAMVFGTCVHRGLEMFLHTKNAEKAVEHFYKCWDDPETIGEKIDYWLRRQDFGSLRERGAKMIRTYVEKTERENRTVLASEYPFKVAIGEHEITGYIDLLELRGSQKRGTITAVDFKTAAKKPYKDDLRHNLQMTTYHFAMLQPTFWLGFPGDEEFKGLPDGAALYERYKTLRRKVVWWALAHGSEIDAGERGSADFERMYYLISEMDKATTSGIFVPNISGAACGWCDYTQECGLPIPSTDVRIASMEPF